jgi:hypothetical protein
MSRDSFNGAGAAHLMAVPEAARGFKGTFQVPMTIDAAVESKNNADAYKLAMLRAALRDSNPLAAPGPGNSTPGAALNLLSMAEQNAFAERLTVEVFAPLSEIVIQGQQHNQNFFIITQGTGTATVDTHPSAQMMRAAARTLVPDWLIA